MFRFKDLFPNKSFIARRIELMAPLHLISIHVMPLTLKASEKALWNEINKLQQVRTASKTKEQLKRLETYRDRVTLKKLKGLDQTLKDVDFDIYIEV